MTTAMELVRAATAAGANLFANGDKLSVTAPRPLPAQLVEALRRAKPDILRLLATDRVDDDTRALVDDPQRWLDLFNERAAHREFEGGYSRAEAERLAYGEMIVQWHARHGTRPDMRRCAGCEDELPAHSGLALSDGARVHFDGVRGISCITAYGKKWRSAAVEALRALGLVPPQGFDPLL